MEYLIILLLIIFGISKFDKKTVNVKNKSIFYRFLLVLFILFMGLRYRIGLDTMRYYDHFINDTPLLLNLNTDSILNATFEPFFLILTSIIKTFLGSFVYVQLIQSAIVNILIFNYIKKHSNYWFTCILFYYIWLYFPFTTEEMRAAIAVAIALYGNDYIYQKKWIKGGALFFIAFLFHTSALFLFITPFLIGIKSKKVAFLLIGISFFAGVFIQERFSEFLGFWDFNGRATQQAFAYSTSDLNHQTLNVVGIITLIFEYFFYTFISIYYLADKRVNSQIKQIEPFLLIGLSVVILTIPVSIFYRISRYYDLYFIILYSEFVGTRFSQKINLSMNIMPKLLIFLPFFYLQIHTYTSSTHTGSNCKTYMRLYPYKTVFMKETDVDRERLFREYGVNVYERSNY